MISDRYYVYGLSAIMFIMIPLALPAFGQDLASQIVTFPKSHIKLDKTILEVQVAQTGEQKTRGLMFQKQLGYDKGMLFVNDKMQVVGIWMKNMQFALDIIWFDDQGNVVFIKKNAIPCTPVDPICSVIDGNKQLTLYVLEVTSGYVDRFNITENSKLEFIDPLNEHHGIPKWIKDDAKWWSEGQIGDEDFILEMGYLMDQGLIDSPDKSLEFKSSKYVPLWMKHNASEWAIGQISDEEFSKELEYLINDRIIN
jgi:uncharacterized membrane protein (UPF0127 family)